MKILTEKPVLWIRVGFNADSDPAFHLNTDPDPDTGKKTMRIHTDPDLGQTL